MQKKKIAVLVSGSGTNLQALIEACKNHDFPAEIVLVISNKSEAFAVTRAKLANIPCTIINHKEFASREDFDKAMDKEITEKQAEFICMAGFMRLLSPWFVNKWFNKLINIHPSLLPAFKGVNAQKQALDFGVKITGCTVHFVREEMDVGPIICQEAVPILPSDNVETLSERIRKAEHICYINALRLVASDSIFINNDIIEQRKLCG